MWRRAIATGNQCRWLHGSNPRFQLLALPIIDIQNGTFYQKYPSKSTESERTNPALFPNLNFTLKDLDGRDDASTNWSVISASSIARTAFLQILSGRHICVPPTARSYPRLSHFGQSTDHAIRYVGFDAERGTSVGGTSVRGAYLSARYESRREETDFSVHDYLTGHTELNALEHAEDDVDKQFLEEITTQLNLNQLLLMPVANLSNGQTRRARIAKALMARPEVLLLDGPFMGLDPKTLASLSQVLGELAQKQSPRLVLSLRPEDGVPSWISHVVILGDKLQVLTQGPKNEILSRPEIHIKNSELSQIVQSANSGHTSASLRKLSRDGYPQATPPILPGEALVEMRGVKVSYSSKTVLGDWTQRVDGKDHPGLWWSLHRGQRCGIFGPNGSGKTTILSLITSDHPQTYSLPIKLFGRSRLPGPGQRGISLFDIQQRMGHSSPEVHAFFPKHLTVRGAVESAWADAPMSKPRLTDAARRKVDACLRWFASELQPPSAPSSIIEKLERDIQSRENASKAVIEDLRKELQATIAHASDLIWAADLRFRDLSFSNQRLVLFLRAIVASPDLVILDEALSGMDELVRDKALLFLSHGEKVSSVTASEARQSMIAKLGLDVFCGLHNEQALLAISHAKEDVPGCVREWICLPEPAEGKPPRVGALPGPLELNSEHWNEIWGR